MFSSQRFRLNVFFYIQKDNRYTTARCGTWFYYVLTRDMETCILFKLFEFLLVPHFSIFCCENRISQEHAFIPKEQKRYSMFLKPLSYDMSLEKKPENLDLFRFCFDCSMSEIDRFRWNWKDLSVKRISSKLRSSGFSIWLLFPVWDHINVT